MNEQYLDMTISLYEKIERLLKGFANRGNTIQNSILVIGVITSGGLWLLVAQILPQITTWVGAALSTLTTGLTLYLYSSGINKKRERAISIHSEISIFLAKIRSNPKLPETEFWQTYKDLEHRIRVLGYERE